MGDIMSYFAKVQIKDQYGFAVEATPMDELRVIEPVRLVGTTFEGATLDTNFWTAALVANGTAAVGSGMLLLTTTADSGSSAVVQSVRTARYTGGSSNRYRAQVRVGDVTTTNNIRRWGAFTTGAGSNGAFFEEAAGAMSVVTRKNNSDTAVASASWNGSTTVPTLTDVNTYEIYWTNKKAYFVINGVLVHTVTSTTATWSNNKNYPVRAENTNTGVGTVETLEIWVSTISRLGKIKSEVIYKYIAAAATTVCKLTQGKILKVILSGTAANVVTIIDNNTGTTPVMAVINGQNNVPQYVDFGSDGCPFFTGLSIVTSSTAGVTVIFE
jgi:hypothetical protein